MQIHSSDALVDFVYPGISSDPPPPADYFSNRMILAPRNSDVSDVNENVLARMAGEARVYYSADQMV
ncbi:hypothetical protein C8R47DRAFT_988984, partial [Mycena vitilis]